MAFDTRAWLKDLGFTETEILDLEPKFSARADNLEKHQLRQSDYSRFVNEYKQKQDQLAADYKAKDDKLTQEMTDWANVQATTAEEARQKQAALDTLEQEKLKLTQAVTRLAEQAGVDPKTVLAGQEPPPKPPEPPKPFDPAPVYGAIGGIADFMLGLMGSMPAMADEHYRLTGERLDSRKLVDEIKTRAAKKEPVDPVAIWESVYDIPTKREAARVKAHDDEIKAAEQRGREAARSEMAIPGTQAPGVHAPVFHSERKSALQRPQPGGNTARFASALASGKYRQSPPAPGTAGNANAG